MINSSEMRQSVVITGASTGIGEACAMRLDKMGLHVFAGVRKESDAERLSRAASKQLIPLYIDVTDHDSILKAAETVTGMVGQAGLQGLINNAGLAFGGPLEFLALADFRQQFEVNVIGQIAVTQSFLPLLRQGQGRIINMSSISGRVAMPFMGPYAASKFALEALTDSLRLELQPWGIKVISIEPGAIATPIWHKSIAHADMMLEHFPAQAHHLYGDRLARLREILLETGRQGVSADEVARVVAQALLDKRPKIRYLVGRDAKLGALLIKLLPDHWRDWWIIKRKSR